MKKIFRPLILISALVVASSCELDLLDNPNEVPTRQAAPDFILNNIQLNFADFFVGLSQFGMDNTRMLAMFGNNYPNAYQAVSFDGVWQTSYADILADVNLLQNLSLTNNTLDYHVGIAKIFKAYTLMSLVDFFGDVPLSQTNDPNNLNPIADDDATVYASALSELNSAIQALQAADNTSDAPSADLFYGLPDFEDEVAVDTWKGQWIKVAKTLKLRWYLQTRLVNPAISTTEINALIAENDLINLPSEAFIFRYSSGSISAPDSRHPWFAGNYVNGASQYMSNSYLNKMFVGKSGTRDPRIRYYFYRQSLSIPTDVNVLDCINQSKPAHYGSNDVFCFVGAGYWGRDHLDDDGIPPDNLVRTIYGLYPAGGLWDDSQGAAAEQTDGARGAGILPIVTPSSVSFMRAEASLTLGTTGNPRTLFVDGVTKSISFVTQGPLASFVPTSTRVPSTATKNAFITAAGNEYDAAPDKLNAVISEYWIALWGNGVDMYNTYRRTGRPIDLQPALNVSPGPFYRSFTYPSVYVNRNQTAVQKTTPAVQVFWDTNPAGFID